MVVQSVEYSARWWDVPMASSKAEQTDTTWDDAMDDKKDERWAERMAA